MLNILEQIMDILDIPAYPKQTHIQPIKTKKPTYKFNTAYYDNLDSERKIKNLIREFGEDFTPIHNECRFCKMPIDQYSALYFGYDLKFCSKICRQAVIDSNANAHAKTMKRTISKTENLDLS